MTISCHCGARWTGLRMEHCTICHRTFSGPTTGNAHRVGSYMPDERRCLRPEEMEAKGWRLTDARSNLWRSAPREDAPAPLAPRDGTQAEAAGVSGPHASRGASAGSAS